MWIEIFKTGLQTDSEGNQSNYTIETLDKIAHLYNSRVIESPNDKAPLVKGHPRTDSPAYGWVGRLARRGARLMAYLEELESSFIEDVKSGRFKNISIAIYPDLNLKHIGFLGAAAPAVKGLNPVGLNFSEYTSDCLDAELASNDDDIELNYAVLKSEMADFKKEIEIKEQIRKEARFKEFAESLIDSRNPLITPYFANTIADVLGLADKLDSIEKGDNHKNECKSRSEQIMHLFTMLCSKYSTVNNLPPDGFKPIERNKFVSGNLDEAKLDIHKRALEMIDKMDASDYEEAVKKIYINESI